MGSKPRITKARPIYWSEEEGAIVYEILVARYSDYLSTRTTYTGTGPGPRTSRRSILISDIARALQEKGYQRPEHQIVFKIRNDTAKIRDYLEAELAGATHLSDLPVYVCNYVPVLRQQMFGDDGFMPNETNGNSGSPTAHQDILRCFLDNSLHQNSKEADGSDDGATSSHVSEGLLNPMTSTSFSDRSRTSAELFNHNAESSSMEGDTFSLLGKRNNESYPILMNGSKRGKEVVEASSHSEVSLLFADIKRETEYATAPISGHLGLSEENGARSAVHSETNGENTNSKETHKDLPATTYLASNAPEKISTDPEREYWQEKRDAARMEKEVWRARRDVEEQKLRLLKRLEESLSMGNNIQIVNNVRTAINSISNL